MLSFNATCEVLRRLDVASGFVMEVLKTVDPLQYSLLEQVHAWRVKEFASSEAFSSLERGKMLYEGREIQFNRFSAPHWDLQDPHWGWAIAIYFGSFSSCILRFRQLGLEVKLRPGDVVAFRGRDLLHEVSDWTDGERHLLIHFTHRTLWEHAKTVCRSGPALVFSE